MGRRRQHNIAMGHALGHRHIDADGEHIFARQPAAHPVLVGMHDDRIVVVDEQRAQRRVDVVLGEMAADIVDVERAGARRHQIRPLQFCRGLGKRIAGAENDAAALAQPAEQRRQCDRRPDAAAAIAAAFEPVAGRQHQRIRLGQPMREGEDLAVRAARRPRRPGPPARLAPMP